MRVYIVKTELIDNGVEITLMKLFKKYIDAIHELAGMTNHKGVIRYSISISEVY